MRPVERQVWWTPQDHVREVSVRLFSVGGETWWRIWNEAGIPVDRVLAPIRDAIDGRLGG